MKEWKAEDLEKYLGRLHIRGGFPMQEVVRDEVLNTLVSYEYIKAAFERPEGIALFKKAVDRITDNIQAIIKKSSSGKTSKTVENIIPHAQEISIIIDTLNEWSQILVEGNDHVGEMKKQRSN